MACQPGSAACERIALNHAHRNDCSMGMRGAVAGPPPLLPFELIAGPGPIVEGGTRTPYVEPSASVPPQDLIVFSKPCLIATVVGRLNLAGRSQRLNQRKFECSRLSLGTTSCSTFSR